MNSFIVFCQILFNLGLVRFSASWKKLSSCFFLRVILITYSITLCLEKKLLFWKKVWKKSVRTLYDTFSHDTIRPCNFAFIRLRNFEAKLFPSFLLLSSISNLCLFEEVLFTGFESQDVTCLPMIAQVSTLDFQQTYNITVDLWDSFLAWGDFGTGSPVSLAHCSGKMRDFSKSYMYIAVSLAFPFVLISSSYS